MSYIMLTLLILGFFAIGTYNYRNACQAGRSLVKEYQKSGIVE